jgi:hypothetical protein
MGAQGALVVPPPPVVRTQVIPVDLEQRVLDSINSCRAGLERVGVQLAPQDQPLTLHKALEASWDVLQAEANGHGSWVEGVLKRSMEVLDGLDVEGLNVRVPSVEQMMGKETRQTCFTCCLIASCLRRFSSLCGH